MTLKSQDADTLRGLQPKGVVIIKYTCAEQTWPDVSHCLIGSLISSHSSPCCASLSLRITEFPVPLAYPATDIILELLSGEWLF